MKFDNLRDELMNDITQTSTFQKQLFESAKLNEAEEEFSKVIEVIRKHSDELADRITNTVYHYVSVQTDEGVLYGMKCYEALIGTK